MRRGTRHVRRPCPPRRASAARALRGACAAGLRSGLGAPFVTRAYCRVTLLASNLRFDERTTDELLAGADRRAVAVARQDAPVRTRRHPSGRRRIRPGAGVPLARARGGGETRPVWVGAIRTAFG